MHGFHELSHKSQRFPQRFPQKTHVLYTCWWKSWPARKKEILALVTVSTKTTRFAHLLVESWPARKKTKILALVMSVVNTIKRRLWRKQPPPAHDVLPTPALPH